MKCGIAVVLAGVLTAVLGASVKTQDESPGVSPYIIGGDIVDLSDRPYTVRMRLQLAGVSDMVFRYCGAARLNQNWFVTAAECMDSGKYTVLQLTYPEELTYTKKYFDLDFIDHSIHPQYNNITKDNNIAVFKCSSCTDPYDWPQLPRKSDKNKSYLGSNVTVSGWVIENPTGQDQPEEIASFDTTIVSLSDCKLTNSGHLCTSSSGGKRFVKETDIGIPMVTKESETDFKPTLIGIATSIGTGTEFTNIAMAAEWISQETGIRIRD